MDIVKPLFSWGGLALRNIAAASAQYPPPTAYSATVTNSMLGTPVTMQIYRDANRAGGNTRATHRYYEEEVQ